MTRLRQQARELVAAVRAWFGEVAVLHRWKVALSMLCAVLVATAFQYQTTYLDNARQHDLQCQRAEGRADVRDVLFRLVDLSGLFPNSPEALQYQHSRQDIINLRLEPIIIKGCPVHTLG